MLPGLNRTISEPDDNDDSDLNSNVSDISDTEAEELFRKMIYARPDPQPPSQKPSKPDTATARASEETNEFELDPWDVHVVVGLRVYSKLSDVTLEVIRPEFELEESESSDDEEQEDGGSAKKSGNDHGNRAVQDDRENEQELEMEMDTDMEWLPEGMSRQMKTFCAKK